MIVPAGYDANSTSQPPAGSLKASNGPSNFGRLRIRSGKCIDASGVLVLAGLLAADPLRQQLPVGIVLGRKLPAARVVGAATGLRRQRMLEQPARRRVARHDQRRDDVEIASRLLLGPEGGTGWQALQAEGV